MGKRAQGPDQKDQGLIAKVWRILPEALKRIVRTIRAQWHGDFYDECERRDDVFARQLNEQAALLKKVSEQVASLSQQNESSSIVLRQFGARVESLFQQNEHQAAALKQLDGRVESLFQQNERQAAALKQFDGQVASLLQKNEHLSGSLKQLGEQSLSVQYFEKWSTAHMDSIAHWQTAVLGNQISLANKTPGQRTLYMPWHIKKSFYLDMNADGQPCFSANDSPPTRQRRIVVQTIPKSGTYFMASVLEGLGFQDVGTHSFGWCYDDRRKFEANNRWVTIDGEQLVSRADLEVPLPFPVQVGLLQPNQFMVGHFPRKDFVLDLRLHDEDRLLMVIRDLRLCVLSYMRHDARTSAQYKPVSSYTAEDVCAYLQNASSSLEYLFNIARCCLDLLHEPYVHLVRHEELTAADLNSSVAAISRAAGCQPDEVIDAIERARGTKTRTFTGAPSVLDGIWTKEVEDLFIAKGGDVLNEKLGYPREYIPKN